jgi:hypothetical protein
MAIQSLARAMGISEFDIRPFDIPSSLGISSFGILFITPNEFKANR